MMTREELSREMWQLTKGILADSRVDFEEALVMKRWLEEHQTGNEFASTIDKLATFVKDGYIDPSESRHLVDELGYILRDLRKPAAQ